MTLTYFSPFAFLSWTKDVEPSATEDSQTPVENNREILIDMISAGACESEYGVQMLMSVYPDRF